MDGKDAKILENLLQALVISGIFFLSQQNMTKYITVSMQSHFKQEVGRLLLVLISNSSSQLHL